MSNPTLRVKLICGDDELNVHDWSDYVLTKHGVQDMGNALELRWQTPLEPSKGGTGVLNRLKGELRRYIEKATRYEQEDVGNPVYLAVYYPECEDIEVPIFGRGWRYKRIIGGFLSESTPGADVPDYRFGSDVIPVLAARLVVKQDFDGEYAWRSDLRWATQAKGHIEPVAENGIRMWEASQNLIDNGDFERGITDWTSANLTDSTSAERAKYGIRSMLCVPTAIAGSTEIPFTGAVTTEYTASAWFYVPCGVLCSLWQLQMHDAGGAIVTAAPTLNDEWERVVITGTTGGGGAPFTVRVATTSTNPSEFIWVDGVQIEEKDYATPFIQPERHLGETWDTCGSHHNSDSSRANGECRIVRPLERGYATPCCGSVHFWWQPEFDSTDITGAGEASLWDWYKDGNEYIWVYYDYSSQTIEMWINAAMVVTSVAQVFSSGDFIGVGASWDFGNDVYKLYVDGALVDTDTTAMTCPELRGYDIFVGSEYDASDPMNGVMYDLRHWSSVLPGVYMQEVYGAGRGNGELPYIWSEKGVYTHTTYPIGGEMENHDDGDAGDTNYVEAGNVAGDIEAVGYFLMRGENMGGSPVLSKFYYGVRQVEASNIPVDDRCGQFIWEGEYGAGAGWANDATDAVHTSGGLAKRVTPPAAYPATGLLIHVTSYGRMYYMLRGQWRIWGRMRVDDVSNVYVRVRTIDQNVGIHSFASEWIPDSTGLQLDVNSVMGSTGHWELHDFGVIDIPLWASPEKSRLKGGSDNWTGAQTQEIEVQVTGVGTETFDLDYLMLMPEEMTGSWLTNEGWEDAGSKYFMTDTDSPSPSGMYYNVGRGTEAGLDFGQPVRFIGDPVQFQVSEPSRILCAICEEHTNVVTTYNAHVIARAIYTDVKLTHRYKNAR